MKKGHLRFWLKRVIFLMLRPIQRIALYEGQPHGSKDIISIVHCGNKTRGRVFIERFFGYIPERKVLGKKFSFLIPSDTLSAKFRGDLLFVESNRLLANKFRKAGFFSIPEWVEFGREVIKDEQIRFIGARKSLKSELKKIQTSSFKSAITTDYNDYLKFYEKMYLPYHKNRFGESSIIKSRKRLFKDFKSGFLFSLLKEQMPIAGAIVKVEKEKIIETTIGILDGDETIMRMGVSGVIDYLLLDWAAKNNKRFMNVGHTRPFPSDGVFFNKRKWLMSILADNDGVMDMYIKINRWDDRIANVVKEYPFIFQTEEGLSVFCLYNDKKAASSEIDMLRKRYSTRGLKNVVILSPSGYHEKAARVTRDNNNVVIRKFSNIEDVLKWQISQ
jgi:hypothetical protein